MMSGHVARCAVGGEWCDPSVDGGLFAILSERCEVMAVIASREARLRFHQRLRALASRRAAERLPEAELSCTAACSRSTKVRGRGSLRGGAHRRIKDHFAAVRRTD